MRPNGPHAPPSLIPDLTALLHAVVVLLRVADREDLAPIQADVTAATTLLQRCVIRVARRTDVQPPVVDASSRRQRLSPRERLIVAALARGASYKEVARSLDISLSSVQAKVKSIYAKLGVHSKAELRSALGEEAAPHEAD